MFLTITGNVDPQNLFAALEPIEQKILDHIDEYPDFERPFTVSTSKNLFWILFPKEIAI